jgi:GYD domain
MATYILLASFTDQGIRKIKDSPKRADAFKNMAKKCGATVKDVFWTLGEYDIVAVVDAPRRYFHHSAWIEHWSPWKRSHTDLASVYAGGHGDDPWKDGQGLSPSDRFIASDAGRCGRPGDRMPAGRML